MPKATPQTVYLRDYAPPQFLARRIALHFDLAADATEVSARLELERNPTAARGDGSLYLDGEDLELLDLRLDGEPVAGDAYRLGERGLELYRVPQRFALESRVRIHPAGNTQLEGLYRSGAILCTQCEAEGFRKITFFPDRPDVMARFTTRIEASRDRYPVLLSNGNLVEQGDLGNGRHFVVWEDPFPKPCYLFALVAGDLRWVEDRHVTAGGREVALRIYVEPANLARCEHAMRSLRKAMRWDEERYGREYDLEVYNIVAVNDFNMGAMENKGLNIFNSKYVLARPETATDQDYQGIEGVIAHEYFHNWTGNWITCRDWFQLSLKEGLTVFRDQEFSADMGSRGVKRIEDVRLLRSHQFAEDASPMAHPVRPESYIEINNFYTATVYEKGAELVRMQANLLGPGLFRKATDLYFARHDGQAVTTDDFVRCMEDASGRDLRQFRRWYSQAGTPLLHVRGEYQAEQGRYVLTVEQNCPPTPGQADKLPFHIPLAVGLLDPQGAELPLRLEGEATPVVGTRVLEVREPRQQFCFVDLPRRPLPSLLRGFSAPVKLRFSCSDQDLMFLMAHDRDDFNRWDAAQTLSQRILLTMEDGGAAVPPLEGFLRAFRRALLDGSADPSLLAEVLSLPGEAYLGEQMAVVDVEGIHRAREALRERIAESLREDLLRVYLASTEVGPYDVEPASVGRRALKNLCLGYLMQRPDREVLRFCLGQFREGHNMTDVIGALAALANCECAEREQALAEFADRWGADPLVMDKWFSLQAMSKLPGTLQRVRSLLDHPAFSLRNPNKVRSLIGAFCANPARFHAADGEGYRFLTDCVLEIDRINPQVAARLLRTMSRWRRYDRNRQALMQAQLQHVLGTAGLSRDSYEIASKALETP